MAHDEQDDEDGLKKQEEKMQKKTEKINMYMYIKMVFQYIYVRGKVKRKILSE